MRRFLLAFGLFLVAELAVIIKVGSSIGAFNTITLLFCSIVLGVILIKLKFKQAMYELHQNLFPRLDLLLWLLAGILFIVPGFISDVVALLLLLTPLRRLVASFIKKRSGNSNFMSSFVTSKMSKHDSNSTQQNGPRTIDASYTKVVDEDIVDDDSQSQK